MHRDRPNLLTDIGCTFCLVYPAGKLESRHALAWSVKLEFREACTQTVNSTPRLLRSHDGSDKHCCAVCIFRCVYVREFVDARVHAPVRNLSRLRKEEAFDRNATPSGWLGGSWSLQRLDIYCQADLAPHNEIISSQKSSIA